MIHVLESEHALIGAAIYERNACTSALERVRGEHFFEPVHGRIWDFIRAQSVEMDMVLIAQHFANDQAFVDLGGLAFLATLVERAMLVGIDAHADAVLDACTRRGLYEMARTIAERSKAEAGASEDIIQEVERTAADLARTSAQKPAAVSVGLGALDMLEKAYSGAFQGASTGLDAFDRVTGGIRQDDVWFIGGRTSMGKSVVGCGLARGIAQAGRGVMIFSLEMPLQEVQARLIADLAFNMAIPDNTYEGGNIRYGDILKGRGTPQQRARAEAAARELASLPITVNDQGGLTIEDIRSQALRQVRSWEKAGIKPGAILIDHIGLVKPSQRRQSDSKAAETADTVNELKGLAKQVKAPVISLVQVNRNTEARQDKKPTLADLNWSGAIEQIADFVCLLYREAYYLERGNDDDMAQAVRVKNDLDLIVAKNRSGPICNVKAYCNVACNAVRDVPQEQGRRFG